MMRRSLAILAAVLFLSLLVSAPAFAQVRDPFDPLVTDEGNGAPGPDNQGTIDSDGSPFDGDTNGNTNEDEGLPDTGSEMDGWLVLSYGLLAAGATAICVAQMRRPISLR